MGFSRNIPKVEDIAYLMQELTDAKYVMDKE